MDRLRQERYKIITKPTWRAKERRREPRLAEIGAREYFDTPVSACRLLQLEDIVNTKQRQQVFPECGRASLVALVFFALTFAVCGNHFMPKPSAIRIEVICAPSCVVWRTPSSAFPPFLLQSQKRKSEATRSRVCVSALLDRRRRRRPLGLLSTRVRALDIDTSERLSSLLSSRTHSHRRIADMKKSPVPIAALRDAVRRKSVGLSFTTNFSIFNRATSGSGADDDPDQAALQAAAAANGGDGTGATGASGADDDFQDDDQELSSSYRSREDSVPRENDAPSPALGRPVRSTSYIEPPEPPLPPPGGLLEAATKNVQGKMKEMMETFHEVTTSHVRLVCVSVVCANESRCVALSPTPIPPLVSVCL